MNLSKGIKVFERKDTHSKRYLCEVAKDGKLHIKYFPYNDAGLERAKEWIKSF